MSLPQTLRDSFYSPGFYRSLKLRSLSSAIGYFLSLSAFYATIITVLVASLGLPRVVAIFENLGRPLAENLSPDLKLTLTSGTFSINQSDPYKLAVPEATKRLALDWPGPVPDYLLVVDPGVDDPTKGLTDNRALIFVARSGLALVTEEGVLSESAAQLPNATLSRADLLHLQDVLLGWGRWLGALLILGTFLLLLGIFASVLLYLLLGAFVVQGVTRLRGTSLGFGEAYRASIYLASVALTIYLVLGVLVLGFLVPFLPFLVLILITGAWTNYPPTGNSRRKKTVDTQVNSG